MLIVFGTHTIDAAVLGELLAETLARMKAEDNRNSETRREEGLAVI